MPGKRGKIEINLHDVEEAAADGLNDTEVAARLGISHDTLLRRKKDSREFMQAMRRGRARAHAAVSSKLMALVKKGNLGAIVWYEKTRKGYSDRVQQEVSGRDGQALEINANVRTVFDYESAIADIAGRPETNSASPSSNEVRSDGEALG